MLICTIGFSKKNLREFITRLKNVGVEKVVDVRLNNTSQLAGYAKKQDLEYVLELVGIKYEHHPELAPTELLLKDYKDKKISWEEYEKTFNKILEERNPISQISISKWPGVICLLCAEDKAEYCHRRLVAEYFQKNLQGVEVKHL
ncbi:MAG: DUF488 domain-containing protein [Syntrophomonadaceae bacterium]|jgi:uncharacterized protein (DUF488 family)|nr:DUF488 domain-containing protein [Syntrophomonadaceae bacterium]